MKKILFGFLVLIMDLYAQDIYATFNIEAQRSANLAFNTGGIVKNVKVEIASEVKKGDILATLNDSDLQGALKIAKANLNKSKVSLKYAKIELKRQEKLKNLINKSNLDKYKLSYESAKTTVTLMLANISYKKVLLDKTILKAPFDGIIFDKIVEVGDVVSGGIIKTILKIQSKSERKLILEFDQKYWQDVKIGDIFVYKVDGSIKQFKGVISKIYPYANSSNRKIKAEVKVKNIPVGLFGNGYIKMVTKK